MRPYWVLLLFVPLAGCFGGPAASIGLFGDWNLPSGNPEPVQVHDCESLLKSLNARLEKETQAQLEQSLEDGYYGGPIMFAVGDGAMAEDSAAAPQAGGATLRSASEAEVTGTNNQEAGVDEGDILKTDGEYTYVLQNQRLNILRSENVGDVELISSIELDSWGGKLLLAERDPDDTRDDLLLLVTQGYNYNHDSGGGDRIMMPDMWYPGGQGTTIQVISLVDRRAPQIVDEHWISGSEVGVRMIGDTAYVVVHEWGRHVPLITWLDPDEKDLRSRGLTWEEYYRLSESQQKSIRASLLPRVNAQNAATIRELTLEDHLPVLRAGIGENSKVLPIDDTACSKFMLVPDATGRSVSTIFAIDIGGGLESDYTQLVGSNPIVYGATDALILAAPSRDNWWFFARNSVDEATDLQWFDLDGLSVTHRASGRVPGIVQDSFGIDVHDNQLRVATTTGQWGRWWVDEPEPMMNHMVVFTETAGQLVPQGIVGGIAPGERIWSSRFTDDRAYIVTFEQIDPLWVIDLREPTNPVILGELEIPGVSTYIHPLSDELLLTIGIGPGKDGQGLDWSRIQVSLFDISNPNQPSRAALLDLSPPGGNGWSWSGAVDEHKAFTYWDSLGVLAVPVSSNSESYRDTPDGREYITRQDIGLTLINVDKDEKTLDIHGRVRQDALLDDDDGRQYWGSEVQRSYFLGFPGTPIVSVYGMSSLGMTAHDLATLQLQGSAKFEQEDYGYYEGYVID